MYHGIINIYKEAGYTSHDVVAKLRGILSQKKIGHTGTLDPDAVGVLPVCLGVGTRLCDMLAGESKEYVAGLRLGITTDTQDMSGTVLSRKDAVVSKEEAVQAIYSFLGDYEQIPPMYSALKVNGKKLYELARQGKEVERKARSVRIEELEILQMELPVIRFRVVCSKGTYIRTLCDDIGRKLGCGGVMQYIIPVDQVFSHLHAVYVKDGYLKLPVNGNRLHAQMIHGDYEYHDNEQVRVYGGQDIFFGIYRYEKETEMFFPVKMFLSGDEGGK